jgi:hypothetical protein
MRVQQDQIRIPARESLPVCKQFERALARGRPREVMRLGHVRETGSHQADLLGAVPD